MIFFSCISCITVLWGKPVNLPALKRTPLQRCTHCTIYPAPSPVEEGILGRLCPQCCTARGTSLPAWSHADWQQLCTPGAIPLARQGDLLCRPAPLAPSFPKREAGLAWGCSGSPLSIQGSMGIITAKIELWIIPGKWEKLLACSLDWLIDGLPAGV